MTADPLGDSSLRKAIIRGAPAVALMIILPIIYSIIEITSAISAGNLNRATAFGGVLSGLGTIGLFILTAWYATETRRMASETEKSRKQARKKREEKKEMELNSLRRALLNEISKAQYFDELAENYSVKTSSLSFVAPTTVYEANAEKIGLLSEEEVEEVVGFYARVFQIEDLLQVQRKEDSPVGKDAITAYFKNSILFLDEVLRKITFGVVTPTARDKRTKDIKEKLEELDESQTRAIEALEDSLGKKSNDLADVRKE